MKKIYLFGALLLLLSGCKDDTENGPVPGDKFKIYFTRSYVMVYEQVKNLDLTNLADGENYLEATLTYSNDTKQYYTFADTDAAKKARYDELCQSIGDMSFNDSVRRMEGLGFDGHTFPINRWAKIDLVSDRDFDAAHPAGTSLADVLWVETCTPLPYIRSGYQDKFDGWDGFESGDPMKNFNLQKGVFHPLRGLASELGAEELALIGDGSSSALAHLTLRLLPEEKRVTHTLTLTLTDTEGDTYTAVTKYRYL